MSTLPHQTNEPNSTPLVASIVIYPAVGQLDSEPQYLSALAAYSKSLLANLSGAARRHHVVLTNYKTQPSSLYRDGETLVHECWRKGNMAFWWQILRAIRAYPTLQVVHLQHEFNQFGSFLTIPLIPLMMCWIRMVLCKKIIITFHEVIAPERLSGKFLRKSSIPIPAFLARFVLVSYYRAIAATADVLFVQDEIFAEVLRDMRIQRPIRILRIGTEQQVSLLDRATSRQELGYTQADRILFFFGTLDWRKGVDLLLDVFKKLQDPNFRLIIAGGQPTRTKEARQYKAWYAELIQKVAALHPRVRMYGFIPHDQLIQLLSAADLMVLPYVVPQRVSAVLNLSASYEKPFIASQHLAGQAEPIALFTDTPESLERKILWAFDNLDLLHQAAVSFKAKNDWRISGAVLEQTYLELLAAGGNQGWEAV